MRDRVHAHDNILQYDISTSTWVKQSIHGVVEY